MPLSKSIAIVGAALSAVLLAAAVLLGEPATAVQRDKGAVRAFMRGKLDSAKLVVHGLVTEDFDAVVLGAEQMRSKSKQAAWNALKTDEYIQFSEEFRRNTTSLAKAGREKNLDAAALAWVEVTLTCVRCHQHARGVELAGLEKSSRHLLLTLKDSAHRQ